MKKYVADFETTTDSNDCRVWAYGLCEIKDPFNTFEYGNSLDDFMKFCENNASIEVLFHNLSFDGEFIISWLFKNGYVYDKNRKPKTFNCIISSSNVFYQIEVIFKCYGRKQIKVIFKDSLKKLPFKAEVIAKAFKLETQKLDLDYDTYRPIGYELKDYEVEYLKNDCLIIAQALKIQYEKGLTKMTIGADSLAEYKEIMGKKRFEYLFPILDIETDSDIRRAYRGGYTYCNPIYKNKILEHGIVFDVNSLYPSVMMQYPMPYGKPIYFNGQYKQDDVYDLFIQHIIVTFTIKKDHIPTIQIKKGFRGQTGKYANDGDDIELVLTNVDLQLLFDHYHIIDIEYIDGWKFRSKSGMFDEYISKWYAVKENTDGAIKQIAKLLLNNLYGKFATNPNVTGKIPYIEDDIVKYNDDELEFRDPVYTPVGCFITAWARNVTIRSAQSNYDRFIYCDTDSIHLIGYENPDIEIHQTKLGAWKEEYKFIKSKYIGSKAYIDQLEDGTLIVKCAGMHDNVKKHVTFENFNVNQIFKESGQLKKIHVKGGIVLYDGGYQIRER